MKVPEQKKPHIETSKKSEREISPSSPSTPRGPAIFPNEILYEIASAGGVHSHQLISSLNSSLRKSLQNPISQRRALMEDGVRIGMAPNLMEPRALLRLKTLFHAERFLSRRASFELPPGKLEGTDTASGSLCVVMSSANSKPGSSTKIQDTVYHFCWSSSPPAWREVKTPDGRKTVAFSEDGEHLLIRTDTGGYHQLSVFDVLGEPKLIKTSDTEPGLAILGNFHFLHREKSVLFNTLRLDGSGETHFLRLTEPYGSFTLPFHIAQGDLFEPASSSSCYGEFFVHWRADFPTLIDLTAPQRQISLSGPFADALLTGGLFVDETKEHLMALDEFFVHRKSLVAPNELVTVTHYPGFVASYSEGHFACILENLNGRQHVQLFDHDGKPVSPAIGLPPNGTCDRITLRGRQAFMRTIQQDSEGDEESDVISKDQAILFGDQHIKIIDLTDRQGEQILMGQPLHGPFRKESDWVLTHEGKQNTSTKMDNERIFKILSRADLESFELNIKVEPDHLRLLAVDPTEKRLLLVTTQNIQISSFK